jgi:hypothetical protein
VCPRAGYDINRDEWKDFHDRSWWSISLSKPSSQAQAVVLKRTQMAKRPLKLSIRIPPYENPRDAWRKKLHHIVRARQRRSTVRYLETDRLEVVVRLYISGSALAIHDVDNRLKDILDALQGRAGGSKAKRTLVPIIPNDRQVHRVIIEKAAPPHQSRGFGHLTIRKFRIWKFTRSLPVKRVR